MTNEEKVFKINDILKKYDFNLVTTNLQKVTKESIFEEIKGIPLEQTVNNYIRYGNCVREIMRVLYNVKDISEV